MKTNSSRRFRTQRGDTSLLDLMAILAAVAVVLALAGVFVRQRAMLKAKQINCINIHKCLAITFRLWAGDNGELYPASVSSKNGGTMDLVAQGSVFPNFLVMSNELSTPKLLICPEEIDRRFAADFGRLADTNLSYFVNLDADQTQPQGLLLGDRNVATNTVALKAGLATLFTNALVSWTAELHKYKGNVALADGSVQELNNSSFVQTVRWSGPSIRAPGITNTSFRLAIP